MDLSRKTPAAYLSYFLLVAVVHGDCTPSPIAATMGNVTLSETHIVARGIPFSVGSPEQKLAFAPQWPMNNTLLYGTNGFCTDPAPDSSAGCITFRGGQYNKVESQSRGSPDSSSYHTDDQDIYPRVEMITDDFILDENTTLERFPFGIAEESWAGQEYHPLMAIGLGSNSTILTALKESKKIAARVWSIFHGWTGESEESQLNGIFVLGGYDRSKVQGDRYEADLASNSSSCASQIQVTIEDMIIHFPNGTDMSIVSQSKGEQFDACIVPDYPHLMSLHDDPIMDRFREYTGAKVDQRSQAMAFNSLLYGQDDQPFEGDMTIDIRNGPDIRISNDQFVLPERHIQERNGQAVFNRSTSNLLINALDDDDDEMPQLGRIFLSAAYLMVNQDTNSFSLWEANPTRSREIVAVDEDGNDVEDICGNESDSSTEDEDEDEDQGDGGSDGLSVGIIAGIVAGSVAGVAAVGSIIFCFVKTWRQSAAGKSSTTDGSIPLTGDKTMYSPAPSEPAAMYDGYQQRPNELQAISPGPSELGGTTVGNNASNYGLGRYEMA